MPIAESRSTSDAAHRVRGSEPLQVALRATSVPRTVGLHVHAASRRVASRAFAQHPAAAPPASAVPTPQALAVSAVLRQQCRDLLAQMPEVRVAFLFGSCVSGRITPSSDIDLAVAADHRLTLDERLELAARVALATQRDVDVIDLRAVNGVILQQALCRGVPLLVRDKRLYAELIKRMLYTQADYMPYYRRMLAARRKRFLHGQ